MFLILIVKTKRHSSNQKKTNRSFERKMYDKTIGTDQRTLHKLFCAIFAIEKLCSPKIRSTTFGKEMMVKSCLVGHP